MRKIICFFIGHKISGKTCSRCHTAFGFPSCSPPPPVPPRRFAIGPVKHDFGFIYVFISEDKSYSGRITFTVESYIATNDRMYVEDEIWNKIASSGIYSESVEKEIYSKIAAQKEHIDNYIQKDKDLAAVREITKKIFQ